MNPSLRNTPSRSSPIRPSSKRAIHDAPIDDGRLHRPLLLLGTVLLAVLGVSAILHVFTLDTPAIERADTGAASEAVVRRFYAAINDAVRTGDLSLLDSVFARSDSDEAPGVATGCDPRCRVRLLHRLAPDVRLNVEEVLVDGDRVAARLTIQGGERLAFLGLPLQGQLAPWGAVDFLRIGGGRVVAAQPADGEPLLIEPLARAAIDPIPTAPYRLGLVRLSLDPHAAIPELSARGPVVLLVERGAVRIRVDRPAAIHRPESGGAQRDGIAVGALELAPGDQLSLETGTGFGLRAIGNETVEILSAAALEGVEGISNRWIRARPLDEILFAAPAPGSMPRVNAPTPWPPGVQSVLLTDGVILTRPVTSGTLGVVRLTLPPHAALPVHTAPGGELLVVAAGMARVELTAGEGAVRPGPDAVLARIGPHGDSSAREPRIIQGGGAVLQPGASAGVRNLGDEPLVLLTLTLEPEPAMP